MKDGEELRIDRIDDRKEERRKRKDDWGSGKVKIRGMIGDEERRGGDGIVDERIVIWWCKKRSGERSWSGERRGRIGRGIMWWKGLGK